MVSASVTRRFGCDTVARSITWSKTTVNRILQPIEVVGADGGTRTRTGFPRADFKSAASTVSPRPLWRSPLAQPFLWVAAEAADQCFELFGRRREPLPVGAAQYQGHAEIAAAKIGVGADFEIGVAVLQRAEIFCQGPFG